MADYVARLPALVGSFDLAIKHGKKPKDVYMIKNLSYDIIDNDTIIFKLFFDGLNKSKVIKIDTYLEEHPLNGINPAIIRDILTALTLRIRMRFGCEIKDDKLLCNDQQLVANVYRICAYFQIEIGIPYCDDDSRNLETMINIPQYLESFTLKDVKILDPYFITRCIFPQICHNIIVKNNYSDDYFYKFLVIFRREDIKFPPELTGILFAKIINYTQRTDSMSARVKRCEQVWSYISDISNEKFVLSIQEMTSDSWATIQSKHKCSNLFFDIYIFLTIQNEDLFDSYLSLVIEKIVEFVSKGIRIDVNFLPYSLGVNEFQLLTEKEIMELDKLLGKKYASRIKKLQNVISSLIDEINKHIQSIPDETESVNTNKTKKSKKKKKKNKSIKQVEEPVKEEDKPSPETCGCKHWVCEICYPFSDPEEE